MAAAKAAEFPAAVAATAAILRRTVVHDIPTKVSFAAVAATAAILRRSKRKNVNGSVMWPQSPRLRQS